MTGFIAGAICLIDGAYIITKNKMDFDDLAQQFSTVHVPSDHPPKKPVSESQAYRHILYKIWEASVSGKISFDEFYRERYAKLRMAALDELNNLTMPKNDFTQNI